MKIAASKLVFQHDVLCWAMHTYVFYYSLWNMLLKWDVSLFLNLNQHISNYSPTGCCLIFTLSSPWPFVNIKHNSSSVKCDVFSYGRGGDRLLVLCYVMCYEWLRPNVYKHSQWSITDLTWLFVLKSVDLSSASILITLFQWFTFQASFT